MKREGRPYSAPRRRHDNDARSVRLVEDVAVRVVYLNEALECGDLGLARDIVRDLEDELMRRLPRRRARCPVCGLDCDWPGLVVKHMAIVHPEEVDRRAA
jgi:hypothetical protein